MKISVAVGVVVMGWVSVFAADTVFYVREQHGNGKYLPSVGAVLDPAAPHCSLEGCSRHPALLFTRNA